VLTVALPRRCLDVLGTPRCFVSKLTLLIATLLFSARVAARVRERAVVTVRFSTFLAVFGIFIAVLTTYTRVRQTPTP